MREGLPLNLPSSSRRRFLQIALFSTLGLALKIPASASRDLEYGEVKRLLQASSPYGYRVLADYEEAPSQFQTGERRLIISKTDPSRWLQGRSWDELFSACVVMVHETMHGLSRLLASTRSEKIGSLVVRPEVGRDLLVLSTEIFPSRAFASSAIPALQKSPRFANYITSKEPSLGTQVSGVYGLLDEFNAYYSGSRVACDLVGHFLKKPESLGNGPAWVKQLGSASGMLLPHQEFRGYILSYLAFAEKHHRKIYEEILSNETFIRGYRAIDSAFETLAKDFYTSFPAAIARLQQTGVEIRLSGSAVFSGHRGQLHTEERYDQLSQALSESPALKAQARRLGVL